jgi:GTPase
MTDEVFKSGFIAIIGRTNVGKSTFLNQVLASKVAIVSGKVQTTRRRITGIKNLPDTQFIFIDTPGIHEATILLNKYMVQGALKASKEVDLILFMIDITHTKQAEIDKGDQYILTTLAGVKLPVFLLINKIDLVPKNSLLPVIEAYQHLFTFERILPISALSGEGIDSTLQTIAQYLPPGPRYFPENMITDQTQEFWLSELIREKVVDLTKQEIPYTTAVIVEKIEEKKEGLIYIAAVIYIERDSQKGIIIGQKGKMLKEIGLRARREIESLLGSRVFLDLWVKVKKDWRKDPVFLTQLGLG